MELSTQLLELQFAPAPLPSPLVALKSGLVWYGLTRLFWNTSCRMRVCVWHDGVVVTSLWTHMNFV